ncbi:tyrosine-type recombinase/integrase [Acinetobacter sp. C_4_1]|uniref:tyrosine-type recombinase/integrase n=1 Tax=unclassified Acinetobacter TaxID=196816 RepID=UPI0021B79069|nr:MULTISPECIES: tyrosine-type recombinase/integrase [unclassified Acinetobacter]MCT8088731.1 tyrosine-type recombinase/integrase [Acinetobacter sp. F_3_1]MCT8096887.1 tyrosine-type recombinase/integrase [Acinetobacter sp. C_3_1]MCT8099762.1 tyrosine-type recombinase/integrase [Acinetobacter sp. C_4_1]MCT8133730.1 tyrosine-type recombinase/integrase [Acinetobacter sp. T_3_1]
MNVKVCSNIKLDLSKSYLLTKFQNLPLEKTVEVNGVGVFDNNGKILPLISEYLSYQSKHEKIAYTSADTYGKNLTYFLEYIRNRPDYKNDETDEVFITVPRYVIQEYLTSLSRNEKRESSTVRNRDATIRAFIEYLCSPTEDRELLRKDNPYSNRYLSKAPKRKAISSCTLDDLAVLIQSTDLERERVLLQFLYDSGLRRSELPRVTLEHFRNAVNFNTEKFIACDSDQPIHADYIPLEVKGSKGRGNEIKPRWTLVSSSTIKRIQKYHASPLYKKHARKYVNPAETPAFFNAEGTPYTPSSINKLLERVSKRAMKRGHLNRMISPHKLRHGNAYAILQSNDLGADYLDRLVIVQKNLGHNHLNTTQMYTSIPQDIYNSMCDENGELLTRAEKMKRLSEQTILKIAIRDIK